ncbi:MAG: TRAP transporter substrate-binding protein, partial [Leptolyngbyaceae cyanobacterium RU_5_1]|nr:TRAP transporter substrate-binding protein [Leptolyngbyaceae cyanobacterium RU_5_1]
RNKPSFIQENADYLGLILTLTLLSWSWLRELKRWIERKQKNKSDDYIQATINLIDDPRPPEERLELLDDVFEKAAKDLISENISQESFRTFNEAYKTVREVLERKQNLPRTVLQQN